MKTITSAALFAGTAVAQTIAECNFGSDRNLSNVPETVRTVAEILLPLIDDTVALDSQILAFDSSQASIDAILGASATLLDGINGGIPTAQTITPLTRDNQYDIVQVGQYVIDLACAANVTVLDLTARKTALVDACQGVVALEQVQAQLTASENLINATVAIVPNDDGTQDLARELAQPILDALSSGVAAFADQTALPASCSTTSTTTTTTTTTSTTSTTSTDSSTTTTTTVLTTTTTSTGPLTTKTSTYSPGGGQSYPVGHPSSYGPSPSSTSQSTSYPANNPGGNGGAVPTSKYPTGGNGGSSGGTSSRYNAAQPPKPSSSSPQGSTSGGSSAGGPGSGGYSPGKNNGTVPGTQPYTGASTKVRVMSIFGVTVAALGAAAFFY